MRLARNEDLERLTGKYTTAQSNTVLRSVSAGKRFVVTSIEVFCDNVNSVDVQFLLEFDAATDVRIIEHAGIAPGSGFIVGDGGNQIAIGGDGWDLLVTTTVATGGSVCVHVTGYLIDT